MKARFLISVSVLIVLAAIADKGYGYGWYPPPPPPPSAPSNLTATAVSSNQINLNWTDNSNNEICFEIWRKIGSGGTWSWLTTVGANVHSYSNMNLTPSTTYYYKVRAYNYGGYSAYSNEANATTLNAPPVAVLSVEPNAATVGWSVLLNGSASYDPGGSITKYEWDFSYDSNTFNCDYYETSSYHPDGIFDGKTHHAYDTCGYHTVMLKVTDDVNSYGTCTAVAYTVYTYYVSQDGNDNNNGLSWDSAFATIQHGIDSADSYDIVEVNEGTYYEAVDFNGVRCTVTSIDPNNRNVVDATIIDANDSDANAVTFNSSEMQNSVLKGFTITGAGRGIYCEGSSPVISHCIIRDNDTNGLGGGMCNLGSSPTVSNCFFSGNSAGYGGGICDVNSSPVIKNCVFNNNAADANGGAVYGEQSRIELTNCTITDNSAIDGGGVYNSESTFVVTNCIIWGNSVSGNGNSIYNHGSGALLFDGVDDYVHAPYIDAYQMPVFTYEAWVYPTTDTTSGSGGMIMGRGEDASNDHQGPMLYVSPSYSTWGNGWTMLYEDMYDTEVICSKNSYPPINQWSHVAVTRASNGQFNIYVNGSLLHQCDSTPTPALDCHQEFTIGAIWQNYGQMVHGNFWAGAIDEVRIWDIARTPEEIAANYNRAVDPNSTGLIGYWNFNDGSGSTATDLAGGNDATLGLNGTGNDLPVWLTSVISYSDIEGCGGSSGWDPNFGTDGGGNKDIDPNFATNDYHLRYNSPCINAGDPNGSYTGQTDIDGDPRLIGSNVDIGADEYTGVYYVSKSGNDNNNGLSWAEAFATIQKGINTAVNGQTVMIAQGTYDQNNINFNSKRICVRSTDPNDSDVVAATIINANSTSKDVIKFSGTENANSILDGVTLRRGRYGINCSSTGLPVVTHCRILNNNSYGVYVTGKITLTNTVIAKNKNYGVHLDSTMARDSIITNCTIYNNSTAQSDSYKYGIYYWYGGYGGWVNGIKNCIIWGNGNDLYGGSATYSCIEDQDSGTGNIHANPLFVSADANDYRLQGSSQCVDAGDPNSVCSFEPECCPCRIDMGAYGNTAEAPPQLDSDGDGIPDAWETAHGLDPNNPDDANGYPSGGHGLCYKDEYYIGWDPNTNYAALVKGIVHNGRLDVNFPSVSMAVSMADNGDVLILEPGIYYEDSINFNGKPVHVRSEDPNDADVVAATIIDANNASNKDVVVFNNNEGSGSILDGVTLRHGRYGVNCGSSAQPVISHCRILNNNSHGAYTQGQIALTNTVIAKNKGNGVYLDGVGTTAKNSIITNCTIYNNSTAQSDSYKYGIYYWYGGYGGWVNGIKNCIIWGNGNDLYGGSATYSCIEDQDSGTGNIHANPLFVSADANDYRLQGSSQCVDAGDPNSVCSFEPECCPCRIDMGAYGNTAEAPPQLDSDGDGIPDAWETAHGLDPNNPDDANGYPSGGHGLCYKDEYYIGWDPNTNYAALVKGIVHNGRLDVNFPSVSMAVSMADNGDVLILEPGIYYEDSINFNGKPVHVRSEDPNDADVVAATIIDANNASNKDVVVFNNNEGSGSILDGVTLRHGRYGVNCGSSAQPVISHCRILNNNSHGAYTQGQIALTNTVIAKNKGNGVYLDGVGTTAKNSIITNCTIYNNSTAQSDSYKYGIYYWYGGYGGWVNGIKNCIIWGNGNDLYGGSATYSCIEDQDSGTGNIHANPLFVSADANDYRLQGSSQCVDAGDPNSVCSFEPECCPCRIDMGAYGNTAEAPPQLDSDGDGIPDAWETAHGLDPNNPDDANGYPSGGHGLCYKDEYYIGWDPNTNYAALVKGIVHNGRLDVNFPSVSMAVSMADNGDVLILEPGIYYEDSINFNGKPVHVRSEDPNDADVVAATIIDANNASNKDVVVFNNNEGSGSILDGVTLRHGRYGVNCGSSAQPVISHCRILNNNSHGAYTQGQIALTNTVIAKNKGNGVYLDGVGTTAKNSIITNCTIYNNSTAQSDSYKYGIYYWYGGYGGWVNGIKNCIIWGNGNDLYGGSATYSCIEDQDSGTGNIHANPLFVSADANDYRLQGSSQCVDAGDPNSVCSFEPECCPCRIDMGAYGNTAEAPPQLDSDGDGIPDAWETAHGLDPNNPDDANGYPSGGHGLCYKDEYYIGWDPNTNYAALVKGIVHNGRLDVNFPSVSMAVSMADNGDVLILEPGIYYEDSINFNGKPVHVRSEDPNDADVVAATIIDANNASNKDVVVFNNNEGSGSILDGVTLRHGRYGVNCGSSAQPVISHCRILNNNSHGAYTQGQIALTNTVIAKNKGNGVYLDGVGTTAKNSIITNCTIYNNSTAQSDSYKYGIYYWYGGYGGWVNGIKNCIIWGNGNDLYGGSATYSCIEDQDSGTGNIHANPLFVSADANDYRLQGSSQCVDAGDPNSVCSFEPECCPCRIDMGAYGNTAEAPPQLDSDGDGIPDAWETAHGLDPNNPDDANGYPSGGHGLCYKDEYYIGWDPNTNYAALVKGIVHNGRLDVNFPSVSMAVSMADNGDVLILEPGIYYEDSINFNGKPVHVRSEDPNDADVVAATIIDANDRSNSNTRVVIFNQGEDANSILDGLTLRRGYNGISCTNSSAPKITRCVIRDNGNYNNGRGIQIDYMTTKVPVISYCRILNNSGPGIYTSGKITLSNTVIAKNSYWGIYLDYWGKDSPITNCTIYNNASYGINSYQAASQIKNCIIWGNGDDLSNCSATYSCIEDQDNWTGNIHASPEFENADANDFHLKLNSPCVDAGDPSSSWSQEPGWPAGHIDIGNYGNTAEAKSWIDSDGDGIPDEWELGNGLDPNNPNDATEDLDGDGFRDIDSYYIGWDPQYFPGSVKGIVHNSVLDINFPSVSMAVSMAENGDELVLEEGIYYEKNINFNGKKIHVRSTDPNNPDVVAATIIDANDRSNSNTRVVIFNQGEDANSILDGLTLRRGYNGISCTNSSAPKITRCVIRDNGNYNNGRGIQIDYMTTKVPVISYCRILNNSGPGIYTSGKITLSNTVIAKNSYWGIYLDYWGKDSPITNCTIYNNASYGINSYQAASQIKNCIIWGNGDDLSNCSATYSCIEDNDGNNIHADPLFVGADVNNFHLQISSPCVDAGDPSSSWSQEPGWPAGHIDIGNYGNTPEAVTQVDSDGDGIPDAWETAHGLNPNNPGDANGYPAGGHGLRYKDEYYIGWDPNTDYAGSIKGIVHNGRLDVNFPSVSMAVSMAENGDELVLEEGIYYEKNINFNGKKIHVRSTDPNNPDVVAATIIDANDRSNSNTRVVIFNQGEDANSILDGLTLRRGYNGISCTNSSAPKITRCVIRDNGNYNNGRGIQIDYMTTKVPVISYCRILNNSGPGIYTSGKITLSNTVIAKNSYWGIYLDYWGKDSPITNCTIYNNASYGINSYQAASQIKNCIIWGNGDDLSNCSATYSCIEDNDGNNIHADPLFVGADVNNFHLQISSPCVDAGDPSSSWSQEPGWPAGHIDIGNYGNTPEAVTQVDSDGDGIPDAWETAHGLNPNNPGDANGYPAGGHGLRYKDEYYIGWDPNTDYAGSIKGIVHNGRLDVNFPSVSMAVSMAENGDELVLEEGIYYEKNINFNGKKIHVRSTDPNNPDVVAATIIDANDRSNSNTRVVIFNQGEDANSILDGLTLRRGYNGISCTNSSAPKITRCVIRDNGNYNNGRGIQIDYMTTKVPVISYCRILNNSGPGIYTSGKITLSNTVIAKNSYWGIYLDYWGKDSPITNCTIYNNASYGINSYQAASQIKNCIIWGNGDDLSGNCSATYSCIEDGDRGTGNIHADPLFANADVNDYHLWYSSPCIDKGDPNSDWSKEPDYDPNDPNDHIDMGAYGNTKEATSNIDSDNDGIDNDWEIANGLDPNDANDAVLDLDGDGLRNIDEYWSDWDPNHFDVVGSLVHNQQLDINFPSVSMAIDYAEDGDVLILEPGIYYESNIDFDGRWIKVRSQNPDDPNVVASTIIDANDKNYTKDGVIFSGYEDANSILDGITIRHGRYGVYVNGQNSSPVIRNCVIERNRSQGLDNNWGHPVVSFCRILNNTGSGVSSYGGALTLTNCVVAKNNGGLSLSNTTQQSPSNVINCTVYGNSGYGILSYCPYVNIKNCIIWGNGDALSGSCSATYSCIDNPDSGSGNIYANPMFASADANDYRLRLCSRCVDAGDPNSDWSQEPGHPAGHIDMGAYGNTVEAATHTDADGDGIPDEWQRYYWPDFDPNNPNPKWEANSNPDGDGFTNLIEYLFGYDPNHTTTASLEFMPIVPVSQIDPTKNETLVIDYYVNMNANLSVSFSPAGSPSNIVRTISQAVTAGLNHVSWDGTDSSGRFVSKSFYNVRINVDDANGHSLIWTSVGSQESWYPSAGGIVSYSNFDPYANIPLRIDCNNIPDWRFWSIDIVKYIEGAVPCLYNCNPNSYRICHVGRLLKPGNNTFYWNGRWGSDIPDDPNSTSAHNVCQRKFIVFFAIYTYTKKDTVLVYYDDVLSNLKCDPYRIVPVRDEGTAITYNLSCNANVTIDIYDPDNNHYARPLDSESQSAGLDRGVLWDGRGDGGEYPSKEGVYRVVISTNKSNDVLEGSILIYNK